MELDDTEYNNQLHYPDFHISCTECDIVLQNSNEIIYHNMLHLYQRVSSSIVIDIVGFCEQKESFKCFLCDTIVTKQEDFINHINSTLHLEKVSFFLDIDESVKYFLPEVPHNKKFKNILLNPKPDIHCVCNICSTYMVSKKNIRDHFKIICRFLTYFSIISL